MHRSIGMTTAHCFQDLSVPLSYLKIFRCFRAYAQIFYQFTFQTCADIFDSRSRPLPYVFMPIKFRPTIIVPLYATNRLSDQL